MIYRFNEDKILKEIGEYIEQTYSSHYVNEKARTKDEEIQTIDVWKQIGHVEEACCLLYTSPSPRDVEESRMPSSA